MKQNESHDEIKREGWLDWKISVSIWEMIVTVLFFVMVMSAVFYLRFGSFDSSNIKFNTGIDTGGYETVDYTKYQTVYFISPGEENKIFATRINDPGTIYTVGYIDKRITRYEMMTDHRMREMEREIMLLREDIKRLMKANTPE